MEKWYAQIIDNFCTTVREIYTEVLTLIFQQQLRSRVCRYDHF